MLPIAAVLAAVLAVLAPAAQAAPPEKSKDMVCGAVSPEDIQEIFDLLLYHSGYDNDLEDQKPWGKPKRGKTTGIFKSDEQSYKVIGSPAAAFAANSGPNKPAGTGEMAKASHVYIHIPSMADFNQSRGEVAFILAHELAHLLSHDPERLEKFNSDSFDAWCQANPDPCSQGDAKRVVAAWDRATRAKRDEFQRGIEKDADRNARQWITTIIDPRTGRPFGAEAGEESLKSAELWIKAKGESLDDPGHGSLAERVAVLQGDREQMERSSANLREKGTSAVKKASSGF